MAIEKEYTLKLSTEDAQKNVDELNQSLELQESLIDDLEKEIRQYEKQLEKTSKADLAAATALSTSAELPKATVPICSSVAGFRTGIEASEIGLTHCPEI